MAVADFVVETGGNGYGRIQPGFRFTLRDGYSVMTGPNNMGKSSLLQLMFTRAFESADYGADSVVFIRPDRAYVAGTTETGGRNLRSYNGELRNVIANGPQVYEGQMGPSGHELGRLLLNHTNFRRQADKVDYFLERLGFSDLILRDNQQAYFNEIAVQMQGSGLRSLFATVCALTDDRLKLILIDEPETSLEPRRQKALRDLLVDRAASTKIAVATHSHLFLNRGEHDTSLNHIVSFDGEQLNVRPVADREGLYSLTFELLGNDTEDLFFPRNYLVVEGSSDQALVDKVRELSGVRQSSVKILAAGGIGNVKTRLNAVENSLLPLIVDDSPYRDRVVALVDEPSSASERSKVASIREQIGDRLFVLSANDLESYVPSDLYRRAGLDKGLVVEEMTQLKSDPQRLFALKRDVASAIAAVVAVDDLEGLNVIRAAVARAAEV